jgi:hypothetical protein
MTVLNFRLYFKEWQVGKVNWTGFSSREGVERSFSLLLRITKPPTERRGRVVSTPTSYSWGPGLKSPPGDWLTWPSIFVVFSVPACKFWDSTLSIRLEPLAAIYIPIHHSLILSFDAVLSELLTGMLRSVLPLMLSNWIHCSALPYEPTNKTSANWNSLLNTHCLINTCNVLRLRKQGRILEVSGDVQGVHKLFTPL